MNKNSIIKICKNYNLHNKHLFACPKAINIFLSPLGISLSEDEFSIPKLTDIVRLTDEEERRLFQALHFMKYLINHKINNSEEYFKEEHVFSFIRHKIILSNMALVPGIVSKYMPYDSDPNCFDTMVADGNKALICSVDRFDPWYGTKFSTYASKSIITSIFRMKKQNNKFAYNCEEISTSIPDSHYGVDTESIDNELLIRKIKKAIKDKTLSDKESFIIINRYGIEGAQTQTLHEISNYLSCSTEHVRQVQMKALKKLKKYLEA